jgi:hypothetical protein
MSLEVPCPGCGTKLKAPENMLGKKARCKKCNTKFRLTGPDAGGDSVGESQLLSAVELPAPRLPDENSGDVPMAGVPILILAGISHVKWETGPEFTWLSGTLNIENIQHGAIWCRPTRTSGHRFRQQPLQSLQVAKLGPNVFQMMRSNLAESFAFINPLLNDLALSQWHRFEKHP